MRAGLAFVPCGTRFTFGAGLDCLGFAALSGNLGAARFLAAKMVCGIAWAIRCAPPAIMGRQVLGGEVRYTIAWAFRCALPAIGGPPCPWAAKFDMRLPEHLQAKVGAPFGAPFLKSFSTRYLCIRGNERFGRSPLAG